MLEDGYKDSELVIALVGAVGTELDSVSRSLQEMLRLFRYESEEIKISKDVIRGLIEIDPLAEKNQFDRISCYMDAGNKLRKQYDDNSFLALGAAAKINQSRPSSGGGKEPYKRKAFILNSLKNEHEVERLRQIYSTGFFVIGVHSSDKRRFQYLTERLGISDDNAKALMARDYDEREGHGQHTSKTYHLSDFFIDDDGNSDKTNSHLMRILKLIFGHPYITPTFDEYAMFMAFSSALRSADLSRQVGAVIARDNTIISSGANDVPRFGGGLYWPDSTADSPEIVDIEGGRDYTRGADENVRQTRQLIDDIAEAFPGEDRGSAREILEASNIRNITEYGRVVHAEMEAILACARSSVSTAESTLYSTTFPCHNCAKHIVAAGIERVVFVEPYAKSKALEFHSDSISLGNPAEQSEARAIFEPFVGVGPRSFFDLFSMNVGAGYPIHRKNNAGEVVKWEHESAKLRLQMLPSSYIERESLAANILKDYVGEPNEGSCDQE